MLYSALRGSFALTCEMWLVHCNDQRACITLKEAQVADSKCSVLLSMAYPSWSANIWTSGAGLKNGQHQSDFWVSLGSLAMDRNPSSCGYWDSGSPMQKCRLLSFFHTSTTVLHQTLWLGHIIPESNISQRCVWTSSTNGGGICLNHSLNEASSVTLITCSVEWVQLAGFYGKMSWYLARI